jgi:hypothetical protein
MKITSKTKFIIYGAGIVGRRLAMKLQNQGFTVSAFFDKNADKLFSHAGIPIEKPDAKKQNKNSAVIITVNNVFSHETIAQELVEYGFKYIICKRQLIIDEVKYPVNGLYDLIFSGAPVLGEQLYKYNSVSHKYIDRSFINSDTNYITAYISLDLVYIDPIKIGQVNRIPISAKDVKKIKRKSHKHFLSISTNLYSFIYVVDFFDFIVGSNNCNIKQFLELNSNNKNRSGREEGFFKRLLISEMDIFQNMSLALNFDRDFFVRHPSLVEWDDRGYFCITDGGHRAIFQLVNGIRYIPCKIDQDAYKKYLNLPAVNKIIDYLRVHNITMLPTPIPHGYFYLFPCNNDSTHVSRIEVLCAYLKRHELLQTGLTVLDVKAAIGYFSQHFCRMGTQVTAIEGSKENRVLFRLLNNLFYCNGIKILSDIKNIERYKKYDITIYVDFDTNPVDISNKSINRLSRLTKKVLFIETGIRMTLIGNNYKFSKIKLLKKTIVNGGLRYLYALQK